MTDRNANQNGNELRRNEARLRSLVEILHYQAPTTRAFLDVALDKALALTESKIGYIYFYHEDRQQFVLNTWSRDVMQECTITNPQSVYELDKTGVWGEAVRQGKPIILNDFQAYHPLKKGYPEGHARLTSFMTVPVFSGERIVAVVGVANKESDYTEIDLLQLKLLMDGVWKVVERRQAEEALRKREHFLQRILSTTPNLIYIYDLKEHRNLYANREVVDFLGYTAEEVQTMESQLFTAILHPDDTTLVSRHHERFSTAGDNEILEVIYRMKHKNGHWHWLRSRDVLFARDTDGQPHQILGAAEDITDRKQAEDRINSQLEELLRWQDVMLGREDRVQELKREVNELCRRLGEKTRYPSQEAEESNRLLSATLTLGPRNK